MIYCKRARKEDLLAIQELLKQSGKMTIDADYLNNRDLAIQARDSDTGAIVGFIWLGVMANGTHGYIDKFAVDRNYAGLGIGNLLAKQLLAEVKRRRIKHVFGIIKQDQFHDKSAFNALKMAMSSDGANYTQVFADIAHTVAELSSLEV